MKLLDFVFGPPFEVVVAHAATAGKDVDLSDQRPFSRFTTLRSVTGEVLDPTQHFLVKASGASMVGRGIQDGAKLVARRVTGDLVSKIQPGAIVVVDGPARYSNARHRLRIFAGIENGKVRFSESSSDKQHKDRPASQIVGVITHTMS
jgi:hypothetical protein